MRVNLKRQTNMEAWVIKETRHTNKSEQKSDITEQGTGEKENRRNVFKVCSVVEKINVYI